MTWRLGTPATSLSPQAERLTPNSRCLGKVSPKNTTALSRVVRKPPELSELLSADNSCPLSNGDELVCRDVWNRLRRAVGPADGQVRGSFGAESEVQATVVRGVEARLSGYFLCLAPASVAGDYTGADGAAIRLHADEKHLQPVATTRDIVSQQGRQLVH